MFTSETMHFLPQSATDSIRTCKLLSQPAHYVASAVAGAGQRGLCEQGRAADFHSNPRDTPVRWGLSLQGGAPVEILAARPASSWAHNADEQNNISKQRNVMELHYRVDLNQSRCHIKLYSDESTSDVCLNTLLTTSCSINTAYH